MNNNQSNKLLASYALFKGLYDNGKDIYGVISEYLKKTISQNGMYNFTLAEITQTLNKEFEFTIPNAVVKTALNRIENLTKHGANYSVKNANEFITADFNQFEKDYQKKNDTIIDSLVSFVEKSKNKKLNEPEKISLTHSFCNYVLDKQNGNEYLEYISSFILEYEDNFDFKEQLDKIREGVILYSGIKFNNDINNFGAWKTELTIFIETEILFHIAGYNGELYKILATDLLNFIREINQKAGKRVIKLKYFEETKTEIEAFFTKARYLLEGNSKPNPSVTAMMSIFNGCKTSSDILVKKTDFYELLKSNLIELDDFDEYFSERNHKYNIISAKQIQDISKEIEKDASDYLKSLNYISIQRRESNENNFENIKAILLTGNSVTLKVAWNDLVKEEGNVPLATTMSFLTNKFWFKLNKRFGKDALPKSFDIISKSQIILSAILNKKLGNDYEELQEQFRIGKLNGDQVKARLVDLKNNVRNPEEIKKDEVQDVLQVITEDSLEKFIEEQAHFKAKAKEQALENENLKSQLVIKSQVEADLNESKKEIINQKQQRLNSLSRIKEPIDRKALKSYKAHKSFLLFLFLFLVGCAVAFIYYADWNQFEKYSYLIGFVPVIVFVVFFLLTEKELKPLIAIKKHLQDYKEKVYLKKYKGFNFNYENYLTLESELKEVKKG